MGDKWPILPMSTWDSHPLISQVRAMHRRFAIYGHHGAAICMDPIAQARPKVGGDEDLRRKQNIVPLGKFNLIGSKNVKKHVGNTSDKKEH